jgi:aryl-alcohol dehydrogenase-like predicted oxidoreductase
MARRRLGGSEIEVAPLAFGGNVFGWTVDEKMSFGLLDAFTEAGFNLVDTADSYSRWAPGNRGGESETIIGKWLKRSGKRKEMVIATKVGSELGPSEKGLSKSYILHAVEKSLQRLQTDYIDLYQSHYDDPDTPMEETLEAYSLLVKQGKVRVIGASNYSADRLSQALEISERHGYPAYRSLQTLYNLYARAEFETELQPLCREKGLGVLTYFSLASGFLTGKYRSEGDLAGRARAEMVRKYLDNRGLRILGALDQVAKKYQKAPATVALAWLISCSGITAPIASATNPEQLNDLLDAPQLKLDDSSITLLDEASA